MREEAAGLYNRAASTYGQVGPPVFSHFGRRLVELADIPAGAKVLDAGVGRGASLFPAAEKVGANGQVIGIDLAERMVEETALEIVRRGLKNAKTLRMDAEHLEFTDASFDYVLSGFTWVIFTKALPEFFRVLRPGGVIAFSIARGEDERFSWYNDLLIAYQEEYQFPLSPPLNSPLHRPTQEPVELKEMLAQEGFIDNCILNEEAGFTYTDENEWWDSKWTHGARYPLERMEPKILEKFKSEVFARLQPLKGPDGLYEVWRMMFVFGTKPDKPW